MKTVIFTIVILLSFSSIKAQGTSSTELSKVKTDITKNTKIDFYETLIAVNNFDIKIKKTNQVSAETKNDFYNALIKNNSLDIKVKDNTRLAHITKKERDSIIPDTTQITGLLP